MVKRHGLVGAMWMFGHVHCALAFGVEIVGADGAVYVALKGDVHPEILRMVGSAFRPPVAFVVDPRPGLLEEHLQNRAKMVRPVESVPGSSEPVFRELPQGDPLGQDDGETLARLRKGLESSLQANDGVQLCEVLLCCLTALGGVLLSESRRCKAPVAPPGPGYAEVANEVAKRLNLLQEEVQNCLRPAAQVCRASLERNLPTVAAELPAPWGELKTWLDTVLAPPVVVRTRTRSKLQRSCEVDGCHRKAWRMKLTLDSYGPAGWRCDAHGGRLPCNAPGCGRSSVGRVWRDDGVGLAGHRCYQHGARRCEVPLCQRPATSHNRCALHHDSPRKSSARGNCNVSGCTRTHWGTVKMEDDFGAAGRRCFKHGGKTCSIAGCRCRPARHVREPDDFGAPGIRCQKHCLKKSGPRRRRTEGTTPGPVSVSRDGRCIRADGKQWRCKRPVPEGSTSSFCPHHALWLQKRGKHRRSILTDAEAPLPGE